MITILSGFDWLHYFKNSTFGFWCSNLLLLLVFFKKLIKLRCINVTALAENGRLRQIAAVKGRQLQSRDLQIVYNFKRRCRSSPLLSLALNSRL